MAAVPSPEYHVAVDDPRAELATLVADTLATLHALRLQGVVLVPVDALRRAAAAPDEHEAQAAREVAARPPVPPVARVAPVAVPPRAPAPLSPSPTPLPAPAPAGGLLGKWKDRLLTPEERLQRAVAALPERCDGCGQPISLGSGGLRSGLAIVAPRAEGAAATMLGNMLLNVVGLEPGDVWMAEARTCATCVEALRVQVDALRPRVVLALGRATAVALGLADLGTFGRWAGADLIATWHPDEIAEEPARKRGAFEHLKLVAARR